MITNAEPLEFQTTMLTWCAPCDSPLGEGDCDECCYFDWLLLQEEDDDAT